MGITPVSQTPKRLDSVGGEKYKNGGVPEGNQNPHAASKKKGAEGPEGASATIVELSSKRNSNRWEELEKGGRGEKSRGGKKSEEESGGEATGGSFSMELSVHYERREKLTYTREKMERVGNGVARAYGHSSLEYAQSEKMSLDFKLNGNGLEDFLRNANKTMNIDEGVLDSFLDATDNLMKEGREGLDEFGTATDEFFGALEDRFGERGGFFDRARDSLKDTLQGFFDAVARLRTTSSNPAVARNGGEKSPTDRPFGLPLTRAPLDFSSALANGDFRDGTATMLNNIGVRQIQKGNLEAGVKILEGVTRRNPDFDQAFSNLGMGYFKQGDLDSARLNLEKARDLNPDNAVTRYNLGQVYEAMGMDEAAGAEYLTAENLEPGIGARAQASQAKAGVGESVPLQGAKPATTPAPAVFNSYKYYLEISQEVKISYREFQNQGPRAGTEDGVAEKEGKPGRRLGQGQEESGRIEDPAPGRGLKLARGQNGVARGERAPEPEGSEEKETKENEKVPVDHDHHASSQENHPTEDFFRPNGKRFRDPYKELAVAPEGKSRGFQVAV